MSKSSGKQTVELSERAEHLLRVLIEKYITDGDPVGSRSLARDSGLDLSPATVRNVMSDLEELDLVHAPHTSAGRIPTLKGYRLFVDSLLVVDPLKYKEVEGLRAQLLAGVGQHDVLGSASSLLSNMTRMASVITTPRREAAALEHIEFIQLSEKRVLVVLVSSQQEVQNRIIYTEKEYSQAELQQAARYLTERFAGRNLVKVREALLQEMHQTRDHLDRMMAAALEMAEKALVADENQEDFVSSGETNLMDFSELAEMSNLRELFDAFSQKQDILHLLDRCIYAEGVQIYIGEESGYKVFDNCSVVTAPYTVDDKVVGVLGVIGPTRMNYQRVIPMVDVTAKLLGAALKSR
jgi:heat-inducible transcriptional repressor